MFGEFWILKYVLFYEELAQVRYALIEVTSARLAADSNWQQGCVGDGGKAAARISPSSYTGETCSLLVKARAVCLAFTRTAHTRPVNILDHSR